MNLAPNFTLQEMLKSELGSRLNIPNEPTQEQIDNLTQLAQKVLQPVRDAFKRGVKVNSGFRSVELNKAVGGSPTSDHTKGMAADIEIPSVSNHTVAKWIQDNLNFTQVILEFYMPGVPDSGWVHVSYDPKNLKKQALTATRRNGKTVYLPGLLV